MASDASIKFDLSLDLGKINASIRDAANRVDTKFTSAFSGMGKQCQDSCDKTVKGFKKVDEAAEQSSGRIQDSFSSALKKIGVVMLAAFSAKKLIDFGADCLRLGSDLQEVQNVVDVTFSQMSKQVDSFAKNAVFSFGLSETMAKKFTGTFGSMAKAFGFNEQAAYDMSTTLTGLAGDVASFRNISQDEAYTKLKSVFTGETESLKDLGVVMTQSALDAYAMANGFGKTTSQMSEMEKVALRYKFVQDQLTLASGDFIRTSGGWANQVRVLKEQFDLLKATIGQGLINVLTPVIQVINQIIGKLMSLANAFKSFTEMVTGKKGGGGASAAAAGMEAVAQSADKAGAAAGSAGSSAKKAAKDMKNISTGIDELNVIAPETGSGESGGGSGGGGGAAGYPVDEFDMGEIVPPIEDADNKFQGLIDTINHLKQLFADGFKIGFGDIGVIDSVKKSILEIKNSLSDIFSSPDVRGAAIGFADSLALNLGKVVGSVSSIGVSIADNLLGGLNLYLQKDGEKIKDYIVSMLNIGSRKAEIYGNCAEAGSIIASSLQSEGAKKITSAIIGVFAESFMGVTKLSAQFGTDILDVITSPFVDNADYIKTTLEDTFSAVEPVFSSVADLVSEAFEKIGVFYDEHVSPMLASFKDGFTDIAELLLDVYNTYFLPVLQNLSSRFVEFKDQYLSPLVDKFLDFGGKVADCITRLWTGVVQPFIEWFIINVAPVIANAIQGAIDIFFVLFNAVSEVVGGLLTTLGGVLDFLTGVFTGDWTLAWEGIKEIFSGIWEMLKGIVSGAIELISSIVVQAWTAISDQTTLIWNGIQALLSNLWNGLKSLVSTLFNAIKAAILTVWDSVKAKTSEIWEGIKASLGAIWDTVKESVGTAFGNIRDAIVGIWNSIKSETENIWNGIWGSIKGVINLIIGGVENMVNRVIDGINVMIDGINDVAENLPGIGSDMIPTLPTVNLPRLAQGGFVRANTPQLAMIGDNRHYGEIVAPEDKMQAMVDRAVSMASQNGGGMSDYYLEMMVSLLKKIIDLIEQMDLTVTIDVREIKQKLVDLEKRSGYSMRLT